MGNARTRRLVAAIAALAVLGACGGGGGDEEDGATGAPAGTEEEGEPVRGGMMTLVNTSDHNTLNPWVSSSYNVHDRVGLVYSRLLRFERGPDGLGYTKLELAPDLAESWEVADDGLTYTFNLRDDVVWHDVPPVNGRPFVADDVVATFREVQEVGFQRAMLTNVTSIEAPDEHTVVLRLSAPFAPLLNFMANHNLWILPREAAEGQIDLDSTAIGTGPFVMVERQRDVVTRYERNPNYFEEGRPFLDGVRMLVIPDSTTRVNAFRQGEIDLMASSISPEERQALQRTNPDVVQRPLITPSLNQVFLNMALPPFDDLRVRQAISLAIDRQAMGEAIAGAGEVGGPIAPALEDWALPDEEREEYLRYDPDEARRLLAEAGYPNGFSAKFMMTPGYGDQVLREGQWVVEDLSRVGIDAQIELVEYATYFGSRWPQVDYEMAYGPQSAFLEPHEWLWEQYHSEGARNWWNVRVPEFDVLLDEQNATTDLDERRELVTEAQRFFFEEVMDPVPTWSAITPTLLQPRVKGWYPELAYGYAELAQVWIDRG